MLVVQRYGGASVGDAEGVMRVARSVVASCSAGNDLVVVVPAMGNTIAELVGLAGGVSYDLSRHSREMDVLLTSGENISMSLLAMAVKDRGVDAVCLNAEQIGIITDEAHGEAKILGIRPSRIQDELDYGRVVIVPGFQGLTEEEDVTTLGKGGDEITAVALGAAFEADICEIYLDGDSEGIYTADPDRVSDARLLREVAYDDVLEFAPQRGWMLAERAAELARRNSVLTHVRNLSGDGSGTLIRRETAEKVLVSNVSLEKDMAMITVSGVPNNSGMMAELLRPVAECDVKLDLVGQNTPDGRWAVIDFTLPDEDAEETFMLVREVAGMIGTSEPRLYRGVNQVSVVGAGMNLVSGIAIQFDEALDSRSIRPLRIDSSRNSMTAVVRGGQGEDAESALHDGFKHLMPGEVGAE